MASAVIPLGRSDYFRSVPREARVRIKNRFFETNPILNDNKASLISRPATRFFKTLGTGPVRCIFSAPGAFAGSAWAISGLTLYRIKKDGSVSTIGNTATVAEGNPTMAATGFIGDGVDAVPEYLYITDGGKLWLYTLKGFSTGTLTFSATAANNDTVTIDGVVYKFTTGSVDTGTPAGTAGSPWLVARSATTSVSVSNLYKAINASGTAGTTYSTILTAHPSVTGTSDTSTTVVVRAKVGGSNGNSLATTETGATLSWSSATLTGGGSAQLMQVPMPLGVGAICVVYIGSYVVVIPEQDNEINGRFYWIQPGETTIDPLDYATAERSPDAINMAVVFSDKVWLTGESTTEPWFLTGDPIAPFSRFQGVLFDRGCWSGTALQVKDSLILTDIDGGVFQVSGGLKRISTPDIEERIRLAIQLEANS